MAWLYFDLIATWLVVFWLGEQMPRFILISGIVILKLIEASQCFVFGLLVEKKIYFLNCALYLFYWKFFQRTAVTSWLLVSATFSQFLISFTSLWMLALLPMPSLSLPLFPHPPSLCSHFPSSPPTPPPLPHSSITFTMFFLGKGWWMRWDGISARTQASGWISLSSFWSVQMANLG